MSIIGHSSEEVENGDIVVIKDEKGNTGGLSHDDIAEDPTDKPVPTAAASTAQQILNHLVSLNSLAALNNSTSTTGAANVTLMPRNTAAAADKPGPNSPVSATRMSSVITSTGSALKRKRSSSASESSLESQKVSFLFIDKMAFMIALSLQGGRGHWAVYDTSPQSFIIPNVFLIVVSTT